MKFTFDYAGDPNTLGDIVSLFLRTQSTGLAGGFVPTVPGWTRVTATGDDVVDILSGDEPSTVRHWIHDATDLEVAWACDGDVSILVRRQRQETSREVVEPGFAIVNHHGGRSGDWLTV